MLSPGGCLTFGLCVSFPAARLLVPGERPESVLRAALSRPLGCTQSPPWAMVLGASASSLPLSVQRFLLVSHEQLLTEGPSKDIATFSFRKDIYNCQEEPPAAEHRAGQVAGISGQPAVGEALPMETGREGRGRAQLSKLCSVGNVCRWSLVGDWLEGEDREGPSQEKPLDGRPE